MNDEEYRNPVRVELDAAFEEACNRIDTKHYRILGDLWKWRDRMGFNKTDIVKEHNSLIDRAQRACRSMLYKAAEKFGADIPPDMSVVSALNYIYGVEKYGFKSKANS